MAISLGKKRVLQDQLNVFKKSQSIHENRRQLDERAFYPPHDKRTETPEYKAVHKKMVVTLDLPCLICGVKNSTLKNPSKNPYGAKQMETHHHVIEWALANAISTKKFNEVLLPHLKFRHPNRSQYKHDFTETDVRNWVDHSEDNLWVLCNVHHRAKFFGIHEITDPIWGPQDLLRDDFEYYVKEQIGKSTPSERPAKKSSSKRPAKQRK